MVFTETNLSGAYIISLEEKKDARGIFSRSFCSKEFSKHQLETHFVQENIVSTESRGTIRGLHLQLAPYSETKLFRCIKGSVYDVIVDMREDSLTYLKHIGINLSEKNQQSIYIPKGFAHAYQTLEDNSSVIYLTDEFYNSTHEKGYRYDDPDLLIKWPIKATFISDKDKSWPFIN